MHSFIGQLLSLLFLSLSLQVSAQLFIHPGNPMPIYFDDWIDLNKNGNKDVYEDQAQSLEARINDLLARMTIDEKTAQMATLYGYKRVSQDALPQESWKNGMLKDGIGNIDEHLNSLAYHDQAQSPYSWPPSTHARAINEVQRFFVEETRLGIPVDFTNEGIRGLCHKGATSFPAQIGVGSTWNTDLVSSIGHITGSEAKSLGYTNIYSPILDLARDPRWGRTVECYGEDPFMAASYGLKMVEALQSEGVASTAKHYAVYSIPKGGRDGEVRTDPHIGERAMHELLLEPFRKVVSDAGILGVMSSYNDYNGIPVSGSHYFLTELLRERWGFQGYVVSDSWAVGGLEGRHYVAENFKESVYQSVMAGLNIRTNFSPPEDFVIPLRELVAEGHIPMHIIDARVRDILRVKFILGLFDEPYIDNPELADGLVHSKSSEAISLQASRESIVLLKNENKTLPIQAENIHTILVCGPNAKSINHSISRYGPSHIDVVSVLEGIQNHVGHQMEVIYAKGCDHYDEFWPENELYEMAPAEDQQAIIDEAVKKAKAVDLVLIALGDNEETVGESKSRTSLQLPGNQLQLIQAVYETGTPVVAVLINGRPLSINWMDAHIPAIVEAWFPGEYGGTAVAEVLFGSYNPGGKLPITFPRTVGQIPMNFPHKRSSQKGQGGEQPIGRTRINSPLYPFGYGLSYTSFSYEDLQLIPKTLSVDFDSIGISFLLENTGEIAGDEVVQLYIRDDYASVVSYEKLLRGFKRVHLEAGERKEIHFSLLPQHLEILDKNMKRRIEPGSFTIYIGSSSEDIRLTDQVVLD